MQVSLETGNNISPAFRWFSPDTSLRNAAYLDLLIYIDEGVCAIAVYDDIHHALTGLSVFEKKDTAEKLSAFIESALTQEPMAGSKFRKVKVAYASPKFTLIPSDLFDSKALHTYFDY